MDTLFINKVPIIAIGIITSIELSLSKKIFSIAGSSSHAVAPVQRAIIIMKNRELISLDKYGLILSRNKRDNI